jgi:hypothetical protein
MSALAPTVQPFFTEQLLQERNASPHTSAAYRDTIRLLLRFAATRCDREPSLLDGPASMPHSRRVPRSPPDRERQRTRNGPSGRDPLALPTQRVAIPNTPRRGYRTCSRSHLNAPTARFSLRFGPLWAPLLRSPGGERPPSRRPTGATRPSSLQHLVAYVLAALSSAASW